MELININSLIAAHSGRFIDDEGNYYNKETFLDFDNGIYFADRKIKFIKDNFNVIDESELELEKARIELSLLTVMKEIIHHIELAYADHLTKLVEAELKERQLDVYAVFGLKWQVLCGEIARALYKKVLVSIQDETTLKNNKKPDIIIDDGSIKRDNQGKIIYANSFVEAKKYFYPFGGPYGYGMVSKYTPYCKKLFIWTLDGAEQSAEEHKEAYEHTKDIINTAEEEERHGRWICDIDSLKQSLKKMEPFLKVDVLSAENLIAALKEVGEDNLVNRVKELKKEEAGLDLSIIEQIKNDILNLSKEELRKILVNEVKLIKPKPNTILRNLIEQAINEKRAITIKYESHTGNVMQRDVDPYKMDMASSNRFYLLAYCHHKNSIRTFRLDRIKNVTLKEDKFELLRDIDLQSPVDSFFKRHDPH